MKVEDEDGDAQPVEIRTPHSWEKSTAPKNFNFQMRSLPPSRRKASTIAKGAEVYCPIILKGEVLTIVEAEEAALVKFEDGTARMVKLNKIKL